MDYGSVKWNYLPFCAAFCILSIVRFGECDSNLITAVKGVGPKLFDVVISDT